MNHQSRTPGPGHLRDPRQRVGQSGDGPEAALSRTRRASASCSACISLDRPAPRQLSKSCLGLYLGVQRHCNTGMSETPESAMPWRGNRSHRRRYHESQHWIRCAHGGRSADSVSPSVRSWYREQAAQSCRVSRGCRVTRRSLAQSPGSKRSQGARSRLVLGGGRKAAMDDAALQERLRALLAAEPSLGYRALHAKLKDPADRETIREPCLKRERFAFVGERRGRSPFWSLRREGGASL